MDHRRVKGCAVQGTQGPWSRGDEAREVHMQGLRLLVLPVPDSVDSGASMHDERFGPEVEGGTLDGVCGLRRDLERW